MNNSVKEAVDTLRKHNHRVIKQKNKKFIMDKGDDSVVTPREVIKMSRDELRRIKHDMHDFDKKRKHLKLKEEKSIENDNQ